MITSCAIKKVSIVATVSTVDAGFLENNQQCNQNGALKSKTKKNMNKQIQNMAHRVFFFVTWKIVWPIMKRHMRGVINGALRPNIFFLKKIETKISISISQQIIKKKFDYQQVLLQACLELVYRLTRQPRQEYPSPNWSKAIERQKELKSRDKAKKQTQWPKISILKI